MPCPDACSLTKWYAMAIFFLLRVLPGFDAFSTTPRLSTHIAVGFVTLTPIDLRRYCKDTASSVAFFKAVNSAPKVDICTLACLLLLQLAGVDPIRPKIPVTDLTVTLSCAWYVSQKILISSLFRSGVGNHGCVAANLFKEETAKVRSKRPVTISHCPVPIICW
jgi:hypothetical protein